MTKLCASLLLVLVLPVVALAQPSAKEYLGAGAVIVKATTGGYHCGTCIFVAKEADGTVWAITCAHVVADRRFCAVFVPKFDARGRVVELAKHYRADVDGLTAEVVRLSTKDDVAILKIRPGLATSRINIADATTTLTAGASLWAIGNADIGAGSLFQATRMELKPGSPPSFIIGTKPGSLMAYGAARQGYSGGPVINDRGQVIGMTYAMQPIPGQQITFMVPLTKLNEHLYAAQKR